MAAALPAPMVQSVPFAAATEATTAGPRARLDLLRRCRMWLRRLNTARALREIEPHLARDVGVSPGTHRVMAAICAALTGHGRRREAAPAN